MQEFPEDYDPFAGTPDAQPTVKPGVGYMRRPKDAWAAFDGPNPETDSKAAQAIRDKQKAKTKPDRNIKKLIDYAASLGYFAFGTEYYASVYGGAIVKKDMLGVIDVLGIKAVGTHTEMLGIQDTTKTGMAAHIRKMASTDEVAIPGIGKRPYVDMVRAFLNANGKLLLIGWYQEGSRWAFETFWVTEDVLQKAIARKRK